LDSLQYEDGTICPKLKTFERSLQPPSSGSLITIMVDAVSTSETSFYFHQTTRSNTLEDSHVHPPRRENLRPYQLKILFEDAVTTQKFFCDVSTVSSCDVTNVDRVILLGELETLRKESLAF
jgi:hypothetical protein